MLASIAVHVMTWQFKNLVKVCMVKILSVLSRMCRLWVIRLLCAGGASSSLLMLVYCRWSVTRVSVKLARS